MIKEGITLPDFCVNRENPVLRNAKKNFETAIRILPRYVLEEHMREILKDYEFLEEVPTEVRRKEATKPMYLIRYE